MAVINERTSNRHGEGVRAGAIRALSAAAVLLLAGGIAGIATIDASAQMAPPSAISAGATIGSAPDTTPSSAPVLPSRAADVAAIVADAPLASTSVAAPSSSPDDVASPDGLAPSGRAVTSRSGQGAMDAQEATSAPGPVEASQAPPVAEPAQATEPEPSVPPSTSAPEPEPAVTEADERSPEQRRHDTCMQAWDRVPGGIRAHLDAHGVQYLCLGPEKGIQAWYMGEAKEIRMHMRDSWTVQDTFVTLMHEVGHAVDFTLAGAGETSHRDTWTSMRGFDTCWFCFGDSNDDRHGPAGDFAEAFAAAFAGESLPRLGAYTAEQVEFIRSLA